MGLGEWFLLGGLVCCFLLVLDGYRRVARRQPSLDRATGQNSPAAPSSESSLENPTPEVFRNTSARAEVPGFTEGSLIGRTVRVHGRLETGESLRVEGRIEGAIEAGDQRVVVSPGARVAPRLESRELYLAGVSSGRIKVSDRVVIEAGACLEGHLATASLHCLDGAVLLGSFSIRGRKVDPLHTTHAAVASFRLESEFRSR